MRICFIAFEYPPFFIGGAGVYAVHITQELAKMGHDVHVVSPRIRDKNPHSIESNVFAHRIPIIDKRFLRAPSFWFNLARKYGEVRKDAGGFDIIHGNAVSDFSLSRWQVKEPRVVTVHHLARLVAQNVAPLQRLRDLSGETGFTPIIENVSISRACKVIAVSDFTRRTLISTYSTPPSKIEVVPNGIDATEWSLSSDDIEEYKKSIGLDNNIAFLFVGRLDDMRKNVSLLMRAFKILRKEIRKSVKLVLVGAGDQLEVNEMSVSLGIKENVVLLGYVDRNRLKKCYAACDVVVYPSLLEGFGLVILEAMASGKPVVGMNRGAVPELVRDGVNGLLINKEDPEDLATAMAFFVDHPSAITEIGTRNKEYVSNFSWERSAKLTEQIYKSILDSHMVPLARAQLGRGCSQNAARPLRSLPVELNKLVLA